MVRAFLIPFLRLTAVISRRGAKEEWAVSGGFGSRRIGYDGTGKTASEGGTDGS